MSRFKKAAHAVGVSTAARRTSENVDASVLEDSVRHMENRAKHYKLLPWALVFYAVSFVVLFKKVDVFHGYEVQEALRDRWADHEAPDVVTLDTPQQFYNVGDISEFWAWMTDRLVPELFVQQNYEGGDIDSDKQRVLRYNKILGGLHLTQQRAVEDDCPTDAYAEYFGECHPWETTRDTEEGYGYNTTHDVWLEDKVEVEDLLEYVAFLQDNGWINEETKTLDIALVVYNGEFDVFAKLHWKMTFLRGGRIYLESETASVGAHPYSDPWAYVLDVFFLGSMVVLAVTEVGEARRALKARNFGWYLGSTWNQLDWGVLSLMVALSVQWAFIVMGVNRVDLNELLEHDVGEALAMISDLDVTMARLLAFRTAGMLFMLLMSVRLLKYFTFQPRLSLLTSTMMRAAGDLWHFGLLFVLIFFSYALAGNFMFGASLRAFSTFSFSCGTMFNVMWGDFDYEGMRRVSGTAAVLFFWSFVLLVGLLMVNMSLGIIIDAFTQVKSNVGEAETIFAEIGLVMRHTVGRWMCPKWAYKKSSVAPVEVLRYLQEHKSEFVSPAELADALGIDSDTAYEFVEKVRNNYRVHTHGVAPVDDDHDGVPDVIEARLQRMENSIAVMMKGMEQLSLAVTGKPLSMPAPETPLAAVGHAQFFVDGALPHQPSSFPAPAPTPSASSVSSSKVVPQG